VKFGDIVRVVELGAQDVKHAIGIVEGVVGDLVDVVAFIDGQQRHLQALPVVSHAVATDPATVKAAMDPRAPEGALKPETAHVAVPLGDDDESEPTAEAAAAPAPARQEGLPPGLLAADPSSAPPASS